MLWNKFDILLADIHKFVTVGQCKLNCMDGYNSVLFGFCVGYKIFVWLKRDYHAIQNLLNIPHIILTLFVGSILVACDHLRSLQMIASRNGDSKLNLPPFCFNRLNSYRLTIHLLMIYFHGYIL